jgi:predicted esterase
MRIIFLILIIGNLLVGDLFAQSSNLNKNTIINKYVQSDKELKEKISKELIKQNIDFDTLFHYLKQGKLYSSDVQKGFLEHDFKNKFGIEHPNLAFIPYKYNPKKKYQVLLFLHGAVSSFDMNQIRRSINRADTSWRSVNKICLFPASWVFSKWWNYSQYENISKLIDYIKESYNVNENDIYINGISDGATGLFYLSNFYQTPFSCYLPFIGSMQMLTKVPDKQFFIKNYQGLSFFVVNGRKDDIFDIQNVIQYINELKIVTKDVEFIVVDSSKHNTNWYPVLKDTIKSFVSKHKRNPFPNHIYYATEKPDTFGRKFWVVIDKIGRMKNEYAVDSTGIIFYNQSTSTLNHPRLFGQIEVVKTGNRVNVRTHNVKKYTLLISPDFFDLSKPITVFTNNNLSFDGLLTKDIRTLLKYNIIDGDRTMLYSSELKITVGKIIKKE